MNTPFSPSPIISKRSTAYEKGESSKPLERLKTPSAYKSSILASHNDAFVESDSKDELGERTPTPIKSVPIVEPPSFTFPKDLLKVRKIYDGFKPCEGYEKYVDTFFQYKIAEYENDGLTDADLQELVYDDFINIGKEHLRYVQKRTLLRFRKSFRRYGVYVNTKTDIETAVLEVVSRNRYHEWTHHQLREYQKDRIQLDIKDLRDSWVLRLPYPSRTNRREAMVDFQGQNVYSSTTDALVCANLQIYNREAATRLAATNKIIKITGASNIIICEPGIIGSKVHLNAIHEKNHPETIVDHVIICGETEIVILATVAIGVQIGWNVRIGALASIGSDVIIGRNVVIGGSATIEAGAVIEDNVHIGIRASICTLARVRAGTRVENSTRFQNGMRAENSAALPGAWYFKRNIVQSTIR
ncbi:hypothetical protein H4I96_07652 [Botrytis cinerea]